MSINEVAKLMGIATETLRYYERIGVLPEIPRTSAGYREYEPIHIEWIEAIIKFKAAGMSLEVIIDYVRLARQGESTINTRKNLLHEENDRLINQLNIIQDNLDFINMKIDRYDDTLLPKTTEMIERIQELNHKTT